MFTTCGRRGYRRAKFIARRARCPASLVAMMIDTKRRDDMFALIGCSKPPVSCHCLRLYPLRRLSLLLLRFFFLVSCLSSLPVPHFSRSFTADITSCTRSACEAGASGEDSSYINENDLTLYCDSKCFDTPSDPYGGLWCNMRGLGQPCRACRTDK